MTIHHGHGFMEIHCDRTEVVKSGAPDSIAVGEYPFPRFFLENGGYE